MKLEAGPVNRQPLISSRGDGYVYSATLCEPTHHVLSEWISTVFHWTGNSREVDSDHRGSTGPTEPLLRITPPPNMAAANFVVIANGEGCALNGTAVAAVLIDQ